MASTNPDRQDVFDYPKLIVEIRFKILSHVVLNYSEDIFKTTPAILAALDTMPEDQEEAKKLLRKTTRYVTEANAIQFYKQPKVDAELLGNITVVNSWDNMMKGRRPVLMNWLDSITFDSTTVRPQQVEAPDPLFRASTAIVPYAGNAFVFQYESWYVWLLTASKCKVKNVYFKFNSGNALCVLVNNIHDCCQPRTPDHNHEPWRDGQRVDISTWLSQWTAIMGAQGVKISPANSDTQVWHFQPQNITVPAVTKRLSDYELSL